MEQPIFDKSGRCVGWLKDDVIFDRSGSYRAFVENNGVFTYGGKFLGELEDGYFWDKLGAASHS